MLEWTEEPAEEETRDGMGAVAAAPGEEVIEKVGDGTVTRI